MPECEPRCPVVKRQLRKIALESPWILKERAMAGDRTAAAMFRTVGGKFATGRFDSQFEEDGKRVDGTQTPTSYKSGSRRSKETSGTQWSDATEDAAKQTFMYTTDSKRELELDVEDGVDRIDEEDGVDRADKKDGIDRIDKANGTDRIDGVDRMDETDRASRMDKETLKQEVTDATGLQTDDMDSGDRAAGTDGTDAIDRTTSTGETGKAKKMDKEVLEKEAADEIMEFAMFRDECEPSCPRRISRSKYTFIKR
ncbi:uncharacterized protein LOC117604645 [Osmia lignaria lignaria]|uniref:uncharacterized protein LOC117604645 n=1 Tax=Osmia lignaria lignaria TaxID=1437193 RepID=UPI00402B1DB0